MESSPRKVFIDLMHDLHDLSILFDTKLSVKHLSSLDIDILFSFYRNLSLTIKVGYSINILSSTKIHSYLSLLLELSTELLSGIVEDKNENYLENFLIHVLNIFRLMFNIGFYGNENILTNNKDITKIRNLLLNSITIDLSVKYYQQLFNKYIVPILFNFIFYTNEWITKINCILPESCVVFNPPIESLDNKYKLTNEDYQCDNTESIDNEKKTESQINNDETELCPKILFLPFQLKAIALRVVRSYSIENLGKIEFNNFSNDCLLPTQLCNDITFIERARTNIYCDHLVVILEMFPDRLKDIISQRFGISNDGNYEI